jgi:hypothetical protein
MATETEHNWKFAQCFGDKGEVEDITEGEWVCFVPKKNNLASIFLYSFTIATIHEEREREMDYKG